MALPSAFLDELRARLTLSSVIARRVKLVRKGREHHGLCPFHNEKTPSFTVNDEKGFFYCFGCGAHGDVVTFEMRAGNLPFREAVERLAGEAGLEVPQETREEREQSKRKASLREVMEMAAAYYERMLRLPEGREAMEYLTRRGLGPDIIQRFRLGFSPSGGGGLRAALHREGVEDGDLIDLGLAARPNDGRAPYDYFRGRVMFPIADTSGRVVAFGARILGDGQPKYLNSPETPLFHKGRSLYNLGLARDAARVEGTIVVVEGYMDVIALARAGLNHGVAPLGTALTETQIEALWRTGVDEPVLCFDGDAAGQRAAGRALERALPLLAPGRSLRFATLPAGRDPDDLVREGGAAAMREVLGQARSLSETAWRQLITDRPLDTPEQRAGLEKAIDEMVAQIADRSVQTHYKQALRDRFWETIRGSRNRGGGGYGSQRTGGQYAGGWSGGGRSGSQGGGRFADRGRKGPPLPPPKPLPALGKADVVRERLLLAAVINHPEIFDHVGERLGSLSLSDPTLDTLRQAVVEVLGGEKSLDSEALQRQLIGTGHAVAVASVVGRNLLIHGKFARSETPPGLVKAGWDHTYDLHQRTELHADIEQAKERYAEQWTQEAHETHVALKRQDRIFSEGLPDGPSEEAS